MTKEKWQNIIGMIDDKFSIDDKKTEKEEIGQDVGGDTVFEIKDTVEFKCPLGKMKLELVIRPIVLDKKTNFSRRIGSGVEVKYIFSDSETSTKFRAFKWSEESENWDEIDGSIFDKSTE
ncbi:hypothetical protein KAI52_03030 [Candidatus Parcubacteria bacterium]|nr:hypothetical protein [Candidatus Parcubacteria bacterium]